MTLFVDSAAIERELQRLWQETAAGESGRGQAVMRALTLNLVVRVSDLTQAESITTVARELIASHPNRTILVIHRLHEDPPQINAWVQANCLLSAPGVPQVCGEQITIDARGPVTAQAASLVLALLAPDLPVTLWLPGPAPFDDPLLPRLIGVADRLIVDSRDLADPIRDLTRMAAFDRDLELPGGSVYRATLGDLGWGALTPWRELMAQFFDTRSLLPFLYRLDRVEIGYVSRDRLNPVSGLLLAGWLAAMLGWTPLEESISVEEGVLRLRLQRPAVETEAQAVRQVTVVIRPLRERAGAMPGPALVRLQVLDGTVADFCVQQIERPGYVLTAAEVTGHAPMQRVVRCDEPSLADQLAAELRLLSRDRIFSAALQMAARFVAKLR